MSELKAYRIPAEPVGTAYYRRGRRYEPGEVVHIPADELPSGWRLVNGKPRPVAPHAWREIIDGKKEPNDERLAAVETARNAAAEAAKALADSERELEELEAEAAREASQGASPRRGIVQEPTAEAARELQEQAGDDEGEDEEKGAKKKGRKRVADTDL